MKHLNTGFVTNSNNARQFVDYLKTLPDVRNPQRLDGNCVATYYIDDNNVIECSDSLALKGVKYFSSIEEHKAYMNSNTSKLIKIW